jgi:YVTN family beta-propeller protein
MKTRFLLALSVLLSQAFLHAQSTPKETLLALSKHDHTLAIVDPTSLVVLARVPVGNDPHEVIASSDGNMAYVSNYGGGAFNTLSPVFLPAQKPMIPIDLGALRGPHGLAFAGGKIWFTAEAAKAIASYDLVSQRVDWILGTGQNRTHMLWVSPDLNRIVTTNVSSGTVSIIEKSTHHPGPPAGAAMHGPPPGPPAGDWDETVVKVGNGSEGFDVSPDGKEIWVANAEEGTISIINSASKTVTDTLSANVHGANRLKFTPDGGRVFVSSLDSSDLVVLDASTRKEIKRINIGHGSAGIQMEPNGARAFVACSPDNYVAVIDLKTLQVSGHIDVGPEPDGLAWAIKQ